ncbi:MAG: ATP-binding protein [Promethearchaeota archaeon]
MTNDKETGTSTRHSTQSTSLHSIRSTIRLEESLCVNCGWCIGYCSYGALLLDPLDNLVVRAEKCINCGLCLDVCPRNALYLGK